MRGGSYPPGQMVSELARGAQGGDRLLHELEPLDRPKPDNRIVEWLALGCRIEELELVEAQDALVDLSSFGPLVRLASGLLYLSQQTLAGILRRAPSAE
jgi:hypothetical protein